MAAWGRMADITSRERMARRSNEGDRGMGVLATLDIYDPTHLLVVGAVQYGNLRGHPHGLGQTGNSAIQCLILLEPIWRFFGNPSPGVAFALEAAHLAGARGHRAMKPVHTIPSPPLMEGQ